MSQAQSRGVAFVVSGPSGSGKTTLLRRVLVEDPQVCFSVSHTTRAPRAGEVDGRDYWFADEAAFRALVDDDGFLEWAEYGGHLYGTSRQAVDAPTSRGMDVILEVEVQGAAQLRERLDEAVFVFIIPPSMEVLEQRLRGRGTEPDEVVCKRLARAREEIRLVLEDTDGDSPLGSYDYVVVNDQVDSAVSDLLHVVGAARVRWQRVVGSQRRRFGFD